MVDVRDAEAVARAFHETYELLAPEHGYATRKESRVPWSKVPEQNKGLMIEVCRTLLDQRKIALGHNLFVGVTG